MPDEIVTQAPAQTTEPTHARPAALPREMFPTHADRTTPPVESTLPDKFKGKSAEEIYKSYTELETKLGEYSTKYKDYDDYSKIGKPSEINEALEWARNVKTAMERGDLTPKQAAKAIDQGPVSNKAPWDAEDWAYKQPGEQARAQHEYLMAQNKAYIDGLAQQYGAQINTFRQTDGREKALLLKVLSSVAKNPNLDANEILQEAAQLAGKSPEDLLDMVMEGRMNSPEARTKDIEAKVAARVAEEQQKWERSKFNDVIQTQRPKFGRTPANREAENRSILESLAKNGIRLV